jgi:hypothetical protein
MEYLAAHFSKHIHITNIWASVEYGPYEWNVRHVAVEQICEKCLELWGMEMALSRPLSISMSLCFFTNVIGAGSPNISPMYAL